MRCVSYSKWIPEQIRYSRNCRVPSGSAIMIFEERNWHVPCQHSSRPFWPYLEITILHLTCEPDITLWYINSDIMNIPQLFYYWVWQYLEKTRRDDETLHRLGKWGYDDTQFCDSGHWVCNISHHLQHGMVSSNTQKIISFSNSCPQTHVRHIHDKANYYSSKCSLWYWLLRLTEVCSSICSAGKKHSSI